MRRTLDLVHEKFLLAFNAFDAHVPAGQSRELDLVPGGTVRAGNFHNILKLNELYVPLYYRPFVESSDKMDDKPKLVTMVYLVGSVKATKVNCSYELFKKKIKEAE